MKIWELLHEIHKYVKIFYIIITFILCIDTLNNYYLIDFKNDQRTKLKFLYFKFTTYFYYTIFLSYVWSYKIIKHV